MKEYMWMAFFVALGVVALIPGVADWILAVKVTAIGIRVIAGVGMVAVLGVIILRDNKDKYE